MLGPPGNVEITSYDGAARADLLSEVSLCREASASTVSQVMSWTGDGPQVLDSVPVP